MNTPGSDRHKHSRTAREFNFLSFIWRLLASLVLVAATYNPTDYSFVGWLRAATPENPLGPEQFVVGVARHVDGGR